MKLMRTGMRSSAGLRLVFKNSAGKTCTPRMWENNNKYGGGGRRATRLLRHAPPTLENPTTIKITDAMVSINMDTTKDYILLLPGAVGNDLQTTPHQPAFSSYNGLIVSGGRNVTMIGGAVRRDIDMLAGKYVTSSSAYRAARNRAFFIKDWTGRMHVEGVYIGGQHLYEAFNISSKSATASLVVQNVCVDAVCLKSPDWTGASSHDGGDAGLQNWDGPVSGMFVDGFSCKATTYQFMFMQPMQFGTATTVRTEMYNVNVDWARPEATDWPVEGRNLPWPWDTSKFGKGNKMFHFSSDGPRAGEIEFQNFWMNNWPDFGGGTPLWSVNPDPSDAAPSKPTLSNGVITWPGLTNVTGGINVGVAPGGPFVPRETVGIGYISPGYVGTAPVLDPPTAATTLSATSNTHDQQVLGLTTVAKATRYQIQYKRGADSTWIDGPSTTTLSATVTGLDPETIYNYRAFAQNNDGAGPASNTVSSTTDAAPGSGSGGENPSGAWQQVYFNDGTAGALNMNNPNAGLFLDTTNERIKPIQSGTAANYHGLVPVATPGPSQANSTKMSSFTTSTTRSSFRLLLNLDNADDATPQNMYQAYMTYVSSTKVATFYMQKFVAGAATTIWSGTVDYSALSSVEGLIMRFEHRIETNGSHTLELSYNGVVIHTEMNLASPLTGKYMGIKHYNSGGSGATASAQASVDDIRLYGKPALAA